MNQSIMNIRFCKDDSGFAGILNGEFRLSVLSGNTTNGTRQVVAVQGLHILDLERIQVQVIQTKQCSGVLCRLEGARGREICQLRQWHGGTTLKSRQNNACWAIS
jgi:hypothetical protein